MVSPLPARQRLVHLLFVGIRGFIRPFLVNLNGAVLEIYRGRNGGSFETRRRNFIFHLLAQDHDRFSIVYGTRYIFPGKLAVSFILGELPGKVFYVHVFLLGHDGEYFAYRFAVRMAGRCNVEGFSPELKQDSGFQDIFCCFRHINRSQSLLICMVYKKHIQVSGSVAITD